MASLLPPGRGDRASLLPASPGGLHASVASPGFIVCPPTLARPCRRCQNQPPSRSNPSVPPLCQPTPAPLGASSPLWATRCTTGALGSSPGRRRSRASAARAS
eukprot:scaffold14812_cov112-Isochrysis_galbana.AAC.4